MARRPLLTTTLLLMMLLLAVTLPGAGPIRTTGNAGAAPAAPVAGPGSYRWPLSGSPTVTRPFELPPQPWLAGHRGVDLAGLPGAPVLAAGAGVVAFAGSVAGVGVLSIDHPGGLRTTYQPVLPGVSRGTQVAAGEPIGELLAGHPGCPVAACLHWGLRHGDDYLDPLSLLTSARVRLYPVNRPRLTPDRTDSRVSLSNETPHGDGTPRAERVTLPGALSSVWWHRQSGSPVGAVPT